MHKFRRKTTLSLVLAALLLLSACASGGTRSITSDEPLPLAVAVSFDALYEIAAAVGGDRISVTKIIPDGAEAHDFEPKAKDLTALSSASMLIVGGLGLEPWAKKAVAASGNTALAVVDVSAGIDPIELTDEHETGSSDHHTGSYDPHTWLSPTCGIIIAEAICAALTAADPDGSEYYSRNCAEFTAGLEALHKEYSEKLTPFEHRTIVTGHAVFAYLCRDFDLTQKSIEGVFAEGEPSAKALAELVDYCRERGITTILAQSLESSVVADTLAAEAGARVTTVYTMESAEGGMSYTERMSENLSAIFDGLAAAS